MAKRKWTKADRERFDEIRKNTARTRALALKGAAELAAREGPDAGFWTGEFAPDPRPFSAMSESERRREMLKNAKRTRQMALKAQAELDRRKQDAAE